VEARVEDNQAEQRYELFADAVYRARPGLIAFTHTEIDDAFEGQGLGSRLVSFALDDARRRELEVLPFCPFVNSYIEAHQQYRDLVPDEQRERFGL
jgi:uncharacterized protein